MSEAHAKRCWVCGHLTLPLILIAAADERRLVCIPCVLHGDVPRGWTQLHAHVDTRHADHHPQDPVRRHAAHEAPPQAPAQAHDAAYGAAKL